MNHALLEQGLAHHRAGRLMDAAGLYSDVLAENPSHPLALSLLGNLEYQQGRMDEALRLIGEAVRVDPASPVHRITLGHVHRRLDDHARAAACYREALAIDPGSALAATSLSDALTKLGDRPAAAQILRDQLARGPATTDLWFRLGVLAAREGRNDEADEAFRTAMTLDPSRADLPYNLGVIASDQQQFSAAEAWFRRALAVDAAYVDARINLSAVLLKQGMAAEARAQRDIAYRQQCVFVRKPAAPLRSVLILFEAGQGNINLSHLFSATRNTLIDWMIEYAPPGQREQLPHFDLVVNAMGDPDMTGAAAEPAARFAATCDKPLLNPPARVARTSREKLPALLAGIEGLVVPPVWRVAPQAAWPSDIALHLPVLVRPVDSHGGTGLTLVADAIELARIAADRDQPLYVAAFHDFASADGFYRKYRVIFIDRQPFAYHLAISPRWLVHYATADMPAHAWKLAEEQRFLENPAGVLGSAGHAAVSAIGQAMDLDYAGIDFSVLPDGRILVFEANPVMLVHPEEADSVLAFKNPHVTRIFDAFEAHLARVSGLGESVSRRG